MPVCADGNRCRWAQITGALESLHPVCQSGEGPSPNYPPKSNQVRLKLQQPQSRFRWIANDRGPTLPTGLRRGIVGGDTAVRGPHLEKHHLTSWHLQLLSRCPEKGIKLPRSLLSLHRMAGALSVLWAWDQRSPQSPPRGHV